MEAHIAIKEAEAKEKGETAEGQDSRRARQDKGETGEEQGSYIFTCPKAQEDQVAAGEHLAPGGEKYSQCATPSPDTTHISPETWRDIIST